MLLAEKLRVREIMGREILHAIAEQGDIKIEERFFRFRPFLIGFVANALINRLGTFQVEKWIAIGNK